jgi:hypothetical protein
VKGNDFEKIQTAARGEQQWAVRLCEIRHFYDFAVRRRDAQMHVAESAALA